MAFDIDPDLAAIFDEIGVDVTYIDHDGNPHAPPGGSPGDPFKARVNENDLQAVGSPGGFGSTQPATTVSYRRSVLPEAKNGGTFTEVLTGRILVVDRQVRRNATWGTVIVGHE